MSMNTYAYFVYEQRDLHLYKPDSRVCPKSYPSVGLQVAMDRRFLKILSFK